MPLTWSIFCWANRMTGPSASATTAQHVRHRQPIWTRKTWQFGHPPAAGTGLLIPDPEGHGGLALGEDCRDLLRGELTLTLRRDPPGPRKSRRASGSTWIRILRMASLASMATGNRRRRKCAALRDLPRRGTLAAIVETAGIPRHNWPKSAALENTNSNATETRSSTSSPHCHREIKGERGRS